MEALGIVEELPQRKKEDGDSIISQSVGPRGVVFIRTDLENHFESPRIGVCGLNPHNGDNGNFGTEEIEIITPAVERAKALGLPVEGPYPSDTIFLKAVAKELDAIVTLYHDQGQIAIKLLGFWQGVTVQGGLPIPITTPAHGTAFDIRGKGTANVGPMRNAWNIACAMGTRRRTSRISN